MSEPITEDLDTIEVPETGELLQRVKKAVEGSAVTTGSETRPLWVSYGFTGRDEIVVFGVPLWRLPDAERSSGQKIWTRQIEFEDDTVRQIAASFYRAERIDQFRGTETGALESGLFDESLKSDDEVEGGEEPSATSDRASMAPGRSKQLRELDFRQRDRRLGWWNDDLAGKKERLREKAAEEGLGDEWDIAPSAWPPLPGETTDSKRFAALQESSRADHDGKRDDSSLRQLRETFLAQQRAHLLSWGHRQVGEKLMQPWIRSFCKRLEKPPTEVVFEPHAALHGLPLESAPVSWPFSDGGRNEPLIEQVPTRRVPSALAADILMGGDEKGLASGEILIAGPNPDFGEDGKREVQEVRNSLGGGRVKHLRWEELTKTSLARKFGSAGVVHLCTHSVFDPDEELSSHIVCNGPNLTARDLLSGVVDLSGSLVYLSSCQGSFGQGGLGDEMQGLVYSLLGAGARCVVGYLFRVEGIVASHQAAAFYKRFETGSTAGEALRYAIQEGRLLAEQSDRPLEGWRGLTLHGDPSTRWKSSGGA
ncbi:CHAT domain-containing protein [Salinibacter ruber]|uniref:CHAT domain-containing protein n=1 Tax=Salinibacter ruber TaxID=146919 RepID=UPI0021698BA4|nr:CHAT domain-containing protein [Salinibacter ruber]MCS3956692.1 CHAT domain-containing protein [Salinibacter ruber]